MNKLCFFGLFLAVLAVFCYVFEIWSYGLYFLPLWRHCFIVIIWKSVYCIVVVFLALTPV